MNTHMNPLRTLDSEFVHGPMNSILDYVVGEIGFVFGVDEQVSLRVGLITVLKPILQMPLQ